MDEAARVKTVGPGRVFLAFLAQGLTAFGGPTAHIGYFRRDFVTRRRWLSEADFADLLALCHFLPGPASSQMGIAIGLRKAGVVGALAALAGFAAPASIAMLVLAELAPRISLLYGASWMHGLKVAVAAVVLQAVVSMGRSLAAGPIRAGMAIGATAGLLVAQGPVAQIAALIAGGALGCMVLRSLPSDPVPDGSDNGVDTQSAVIALGLFVVLLLALPIAASFLQNPGLGLAGVFYRTGSLVFGGGHVVLPLLQREVVGRGWMGSDIFLAGYGLVQALPGPLFAFAGYVGAAQRYGPGGVFGGLIALFAIFLPGLLLIVGVLPFWDRLKREPWAQGMAAGVGAVIVGVLAATLWNPVLTSAVHRPADWALVAAAFVFLQVARLPPWLVVTGFALATGLLRV